MGVKSNFQILLVPNYRAFRITVIYVIHLEKTLKNNSYYKITMQRARYPCQITRPPFQIPSYTRSRSFRNVTQLNPALNPGIPPSKFGVFRRKSKGFLRPDFFPVTTPLFEYRTTGCASFPTMLENEKSMKNFKRQLQPPQ